MHYTLDSFTVQAGGYKDLPWFPLVLQRTSTWTLSCISQQAETKTRDEDGDIPVSPIVSPIRGHGAILSPTHQNPVAVHMGGIRPMSSGKTTSTPNTAGTLCVSALVFQPHSQPTEMWLSWELQFTVCSSDRLCTCFTVRMSKPCKWQFHTLCTLPWVHECTCTEFSNGTWTSNMETFVLHFQDTVWWERTLFPQYTLHVVCQPHSDLQPILEDPA